MVLWYWMSLCGPPFLTCYEFHLHRLCSWVISHVWQTYSNLALPLSYIMVVWQLKSHIELKSQVQYWTAPMSQHDDEWAGAVWVVPGKVYCAVITNKHDERITFFNKIYEPAVPEPYLCECCRIHVLASGRPVSGSYIIYCGQVKQGLQGGVVGCYFIEDNRIKFELWFRPSTD